jgi:hypothetical protein
MREADERLAGRVRVEIERALGRDVDVTQVRLSENDHGVTLTVECATPVGPWRVEASGAGLIDAIAALHQRAVEDRVAIGFRELVARP